MLSFRLYYDMIYRLLYYLIKFTCYFYFKKIRLYHPEKLNQNHPLIICANHGNSFMDAILIAISSKRKLHFLVRSDVFDTPFKRWFFGQLNMMPIYRIRDGRAALKQNENIFLKCDTILKANGAIVIFPEGNCVVEKRLRAFKTGFVHLAFNTNVSNLKVQVIGLNYSNPDKFYTHASLTFLEPILVAEIKILTQNNEFDFNKLLMKKTYDLLYQNMVYIPSSADDKFYEAILEIKRNNAIVKKENFLNQQIETTSYLTELKMSNNQKFNQLQQEVLLYFNELKNKKVEDIAFAKEHISVFKAVLVFPFCVLGYLLNIFPKYLIEAIINNKIKERQFKSSVRMVLCLVVYPLYSLVLSYFLNFAFHNFLFSLSVIVSILVLYYLTFEIFNIYKQQKSLKLSAESVNNLKNLRFNITNTLNL